MTARDLNTYRIAGRRGARLGLVAPDDFELVLLGPWCRSALPAGSLAYCADMRRERVLFTSHRPDDLARVLAAPFMTDMQLDTASGVISVPFERLAELVPQEPAPPVLVFSPGRTGSTLLVRVLAASGCACASEPDLLAQVAMAPRENFLLLPPGTRAALAASCLHALGRVLGAGAIVKLRSQCNARPLMLVQAAAGCRTVFMLRGVAAWATSRHRAFAEPPDYVAFVLREAMDALDKLLFCEAPCTVLWYETLVTDPSAALLACAPGTSSNPAWHSQVMLRDSQAGTFLARETVAARSVQDGFMEAFAAAWVAARAGAVWHPTTQALLAQMWAR